MTRIIATRWLQLLIAAPPSYACGLRRSRRRRAWDVGRRLREGFVIACLYGGCRRNFADPPLMRARAAILARRALRGKANSWALNGAQANGRGQMSRVTGVVPQSASLSSLVDLLAGVEADLNWVDFLRRQIPRLTAVTVTTAVRLVRDRAGPVRLVMNNWLLYGTGGWAYGDGRITRTQIAAAREPPRRFRRLPARSKRRRAHAGLDGRAPASMGICARLVNSARIPDSISALAVFDIPDGETGGRTRSC